MGNLGDRLFRAPGLLRGQVVDWINLPHFPWTFNLADASITCAAVMIAILALRGTRIDGTTPAHATPHLHPARPPASRPGNWPPEITPPTRTRRHPRPPAGDHPSECTPATQHATPPPPHPRPPKGAPASPGASGLRPVIATVTPTPIMASPPAPPTSSNRRGELANQVRTPLAANPQAQSEAPPISTATSASSSICPTTSPRPSSRTAAR